MTATNAMDEANAMPAPARHRSRRWWRGGLFVAILTLVAVAWFLWQRQEARRAGQEAVRLAQQGRFADAEPRLLAALNRDTDNVELLKALTLGLLASERLDEAEPVLSHWCQLRPAEAEPYRLRMYLRHRASSRGKTEAEKQRLQEQALADGMHVLELDANDDSAAQEVAWLGLAVGRFEEADRVCRRCRERRPEDAFLLYLQARLCHAQGANEEAEQLLDQLVSNQPQFTRGLLLRAILYNEAKQPAKSIPLLRQVLAQDQAHQQEARYHLGLALARTGQPEEARQVLAEVERDNLERSATLSGHLDNPAVQIRRAELLLGLGQAEEAVALLQAVLREEPRQATAHALLASFYEKQGELPKAAQHRQRVGQ